MIPEDNDIEEPKVGGLYLSQIIFISYFIPVILLFVQMSMGINVPKSIFGFVIVLCCAGMGSMAAGVPGYIFICTGRHPDISRLYKKNMRCKTKRRVQ